MDLDVRMKAYEATFRDVLPVRMPAVIRLDGKAFHTLTRNCERPFDMRVWQSLVDATGALMEEIPARMAYQQSDEVSLLLIDYNRFDTQQWFGGIVQKMVSVAASIMGVEFTSRFGHKGFFDARVFVVPERDIKNYFVWRQQDAMGNAVSMAAQAAFSPKQLHGKHSTEMIEMLKEKGIDFLKYPECFRRGTIVTKDQFVQAPVFSKTKDVLEKFLKIEEE